MLEEDSGEIMTPIPARDRRSIVLAAMGRPPILHRGEFPVPCRVPAGSTVHVYVDVSGSIAGLKGALYGAVLDCRQWVHPSVHLAGQRSFPVSGSVTKSSGVNVSEGGSWGTGTIVFTAKPWGSSNSRSTRPLKPTPSIDTACTSLP